VNIESLNNYFWGRFDIENNYNGQVGYLKDSNMKGRVTVFRSGKLISTGAKSIDSSIEQLDIAYQLLLNNKFITKTIIESKIRNIVATSKLNEFSFDSFIHRHGVLYEPEQFPGAIYKTKHSTTVLVFSSAKVVITGAKEEKQITDTIYDLKGIFN
jgi:transcription initiation factor TFIID TATA-box-binding protein